MFHYADGAHLLSPISCFRASTNASRLAKPRCWPVRGFSKQKRHTQSLFYACFVARSVDLKLMDLENLHVAGDGSKLPTWANPHGKKLCHCDNRGKKPEERCHCPRAYHDPLALWGWDSYRQCWVYGHSFYELTAYSLQHRCQLPAVVSMADCNCHDCVHGLTTLYRGHEIFDLPIQTAGAAGT